VDQPEFTPGGQLSESGKFHRAAQACRDGAQPERVRVYEKIRQGIWSYNGVFHLVDSWLAQSNLRKFVRIEGDPFRLADDGKGWRA